jgi:hypothetical protein
MTNLLRSGSKSEQPRGKRDGKFRDCPLNGHVGDGLD